MRAVAIAVFGLLTLTSQISLATEVINIYSHRQPFLIQPFIEAYKAKNDVEINVIFAKRGLAQRLSAEGRNSPADLVLTVDIARIHQFADAGLLQPVASPVLNAKIPANLRASDGTWYGLSRRARVIVVAKAADDMADLNDYEDLADPKWRGRLCSRPGSHVYNRALLGSLIHHLGADEATQWAHGFVENLARKPQGNDRAQVKAIWSGECDAGIINSYYFGKLVTSDIAEHRAWADSVRMVFPNQSNRGAHVNISGGGVARYAKNVDAAVAFLEWLVSDEGQLLYQKINYEFAINPAAAKTGMIASWGNFKTDGLALEQLPPLTQDAQKIIDATGW
jgi:iron(III) transport system substrate-binding protein